MTNIRIDIIPHSDQRYDTAGDWVWEPHTDTLRLFVSKMPLEAQEALIIIHELVEAFLCGHQGVSQKEVDFFDLAWKPHDGIEEPGDDPHSPYYLQHQMATAIERMMAIWLDVNWQLYEKDIRELQWRPHPDAQE